MSKPGLSIVKFAPKGEDSFFDAIKAGVNDYFTAQNISQYSNRKMHIKTVAMLSMYFVPYLFIVTSLTAHSIWIFYGLWLLMGVGIAGIGTSVMHDSNHGSYSTNETLNSFLGGTLNVLGGYARNWKIQHNILHHTYTNIEGLDEDIDAGAFLRMSPHARLRGMHRYQHIYAWPLYCLMNLFWVVAKDYKAILKYHKTGLLKKTKISLGTAIREMTIWKLVYAAYILVLPIMFSGFAWWQVVAGFVLMHMLAGLILACVFQLAHIMETSEYPLPADDRKMENNWAVHQLLNTTNFAPNNKVLSWYIGGLNFQIEHHLFPHVCHVHYPAISKIVQQAAQEHNLEYNVQPTFLLALREHGRMLKKLGQA